MKNETAIDKKWAIISHGAISHFRTNNNKIENLWRKKNALYGHQDRRNTTHTHTPPVFTFNLLLLFKCSTSVLFLLLFGAMTHLLALFCSVTTFTLTCTEPLKWKLWTFFFTLATMFGRAPKTENQRISKTNQTSHWKINWQPGDASLSLSWVTVKTFDL